MTPPRILVLDQDGTHRSQCCDAIRRAGFEPVIVWETNRLATVLAEEAPVAALLEPEAGGVGSTAFDDLRRSGIPYFGMTSLWGGAANRALGIAWDGCAEFWEKPVPLDELESWLRRLFPDVRPPAPGDSVAASDATPARQQITIESDAVPSAAAVAERTASRAAAPVPSPEARSEATPVPGAVDALRRMEARMAAAPLDTPTADAPFPVPVPSARQAAPTPPVTPVAGPFTPALLDVHRVQASGSFSDHSFATLLAWLAYQRSTGALMMQSGEDKKLAYLQEGFVVGVKTNHSDDSLTEMMVAQGLITSAQRAQVEAHAQQGRLTSSHSLVELGMFSRDEVETLVSTHLRNRLMDVFEWDSGMFTFREGAVPRGYNHEPVVSPMDFIWQGVQHSVPLSMARSAFAGVMDAPMVWLTDPPSDEDMPVTASQRALWSDVDRGMTLSGLQSARRLTEPVWRVAYVLAATGFLGFRPG